MNKPPIHVWFEEGREDGVPVRRMILEGIQVSGGEKAVTWWRFPGHAEVPPLELVDSLVGGHLLWASTLGQDLVIHGVMSRTGLQRLQQLLEIRHALAPVRYQPITLHPDHIRPAPPPRSTPGRTLAAMSGGLDSTFTVYRHAHRLLGDRSYPLDGLVLVFGFDVPLHRADRFAALHQRIERMAQAVGLPLLNVQTNAGELGGGTWPQSSMPLFSSVLAQCTGPGGTGLVSAGAPYGSAYVALSHTPPLDALCTNDDFRLVTDGAGFGRADKVEALLPYPEAVANLRVCWQGPDPAKNCGVCEKCVMTRINFLCAGVRHPPCFDTPISVDHIRQLPLSSLHQARDFFRFCLVEMEARGTRGPEADLLRRRLSRVPPDHLAPGLWSLVRRMRSCTGGRA